MENSVEETNDQVRWRLQWIKKGQPWRREPEIEPKRMRELLDKMGDQPKKKFPWGIGTHPAMRETIEIFGNKEQLTSIESGEDIHDRPFENMVLGRADVEWLLARHDGNQGPVNWENPADRTRSGIDLRGALLGGVGNAIDLSGLPLARSRLTDAHLQAANLFKTHLEGADLERAHLEGANLARARLDSIHAMQIHLEGAILYDASLQETFLVLANFELANLQKADFQKADLRDAVFHGAELKNAHLEGCDLSSASFAGPSRTDWEEIRKWNSEPHLQTYKEWADMREVFFDSATNLSEVKLCRLSETGGTLLSGALLMDVHWGDTNLGVIAWEAQMPKKGPLLGDELTAGKPTKENALSSLQEAVRATRQMAVILRNQGLNEEGDRFAYRAQKIQRVVLLKQGLKPYENIWYRLRKIGSSIFSLALDLLAGYGYHPMKTVLWYLLVIVGFGVAYHIFGKLSLYPPDAFIYSLTSFHGRGFFPGLQGNPSLHDPLILLAAVEAVIGLFIEASFIATFTQRFFGK